MRNYRNLIREILAEDEGAAANKEKYHHGNLTAELREMLFQLV